ncbi:hypothetical protein [Burkholderia glumae]|uniref:hypothetical protein n=3 Tax=Burkholderia glumae TaxID=337 RepID=UPI0020371C8A|nr:hypothetical protein [Burkholderia glumae]MCM2495755.1 hypothetical protein [Burkholderia glumae]MCM2546717.1 hypothetical protein [Burkholderia glumae]
MKPTRLSSTDLSHPLSPTDRQPAESKAPPQPSRQGRPDSRLSGLASMARGGEPGVRHAAMLTPQQARFASALQAGRRVSQQGLQQADDEALAAGIAASLAAMPEDGRGQPAEPQASLQSRVDSALDAGARVSQQALERAYDPELQAAIAESLRPAGSGGASEQAAFRARVDSALDAGVKVSQQALERAYGPAPAVSRSPDRPLPSATAGAGRRRLPPLEAPVRRLSSASASGSSAASPSSRSPAASSATSMSAFSAPPSPHTGFSAVPGDEERVSLDDFAPMGMPPFIGESFGGQSKRAAVPKAQASEETVSLDDFAPMGMPPFIGESFGRQRWPAGPDGTPHSGRQAELEKMREMIEQAAEDLRKA